jgi:hypothetical protein
MYEIVGVEWEKVMKYEDFESEICSEMNEMKWNESSEIYTGERKLCRWAL